MALRDGVSSTERTQEAFSDIFTSSKHVKEKSEEINNSIDTTQKGLKEISGDINGIISSSRTVNNEITDLNVQASQKSIIFSDIINFLEQIYTISIENMNGKEK
ncbi:hypothetical protein [Clostridium muellerianum]|uniref:hypothetical protein n=1 Tax=Clostridium muellerianum TaxID=2716538 RepID=UPI001FACFF88|nr:hypothetical protein [Clostridium muellerianum]